MLRVCLSQLSMYAGCLSGYLYEHGPLSVAVDATDDPWQDYTSGIMQCSESTTQINHAVVLVGYGEEDGKDYWIVRK